MKRLSSVAATLILGLGVAVAQPARPGPVEPAVPIVPGGQPRRVKPPPPPPPPRLSAPQGQCAPGKAIALRVRRLSEKGKIEVRGLKTRRSLKIERTAEGLIARLPAGLTGERDSVLSLRYISAAGRRSNTTSCRVRARRVPKFMKLTAFTTANCASSGVAGADENQSMGQFAICRHAGPNTEGIDHWAGGELAPGWVVRQVIFEDVSTGGGRVEVDITQSVGKMKADIQPKWSTGSGVATYRLAIQLMGPVGTSPYPAPR